MKRVLFIQLFLLLISPVWAQVRKATYLQPQKIKGGRFLKRNISFSDYNTTNFHRTLGSYFSFRTPHLANLLVVEGVPFYKKDKRRSKDVIRFNLKKGGEKVGQVQSRAVFIKNETFRLFSQQDSSFFGKRNADFLEASILAGNGATNEWDMVAANLNGSKEEEQKGVIRKGNQEIRFVKSTLLLNEKIPVKSDISSLLATINEVYAFTYNNEIVAAVSFRTTDRRIWLKENLDEEIKTVISSVSALLTLRRQLYR